MLARIDVALDEVRHKTLVDAAWVVDMLLELRGEAQLLDALAGLVPSDVAD